MSRASAHRNDNGVFHRSVSPPRARAVAAPGRRSQGRQVRVSRTCTRLNLIAQETLCHQLLTPRRSKSPPGKPVVPRASCAPAPRSRSSGCPRAKSSACTRCETRTALARTERARFPARVEETWTVFRSISPYPTSGVSVFRGALVVRASRRHGRRDTTRRLDNARGTSSASTHRLTFKPFLLRSLDIRAQQGKGPPPR